ncbi:sigma-70 family RNA polymerase sigma factor [Nocardia sp. CDC160]|uniref:sigma-70 family RNA polymerase sigma factor n=1 Tax=Nocardia sp. CDC160 TaxID=3112166 RepID=UPI002DBD3D70|nr:sigma-70 family RNA polymerase sigma factor [Nocardia sp. CDC160]MEC3918007.1 sigma-70 family RNA polymerase sigma factor [Nocardia sp. CDC160]
MSDTDSGSPAERFERRRARLTALAFRMLGASGEAEDAVQETWMRLSRTDIDDIRNLDGWLTTVLSRICLDVLRAREVRQEYPLGSVVPETIPSAATLGPEDRAVLTEEMERAVLVLLHRLHPAERVAFVLHDMFEVPFYEIAEILNRSPNAARLLASKARHRVVGESDGLRPDTLREHRIVRAFLAAVRAGDITAVLNLLAPDITVSADKVAAPGRVPVTASGARTVARLAAGFATRAEFAAVVLVDGRAGALVAARDEAPAVMAFTIEGERIVRIEVIAEPDALAALSLTVPDLGR